MKQLDVLLYGPVRATLDGHAVDIGGRSQRRLLALLALRPGRPVSITELIDSYWPDDAGPASPVETIHTYAYRLRRSLEGAAAVESRSGGYQLAIDPDLVDATRLERALQQTETAPPNERLAVLLDATPLDSNPPLSGFEHEGWARPHVARLAELRWYALDSIAEAQLDTGRIDEAVVALRATTVEQPLRQRTRRNLMTALYRAGRQGEALRAFQEYRYMLGEELGLVPSNELVDLDARIAAGDPDLDTARSSTRRVRSYELIESLGSGAWGEVWRARHASLGHDVAIKTVARGLSDQAAFIRRFEIESRVVASLDHPHIVPLIDAWRDTTGAYRVTRLFPGGSALQRLRDGATWTPRDVLTAAQQIGGALSAAHAAGIVHHDVKPSNLLLDESGDLFLTDFGIATMGAPTLGPLAHLDVSRDVIGLATTLRDLLGETTSNSQTLAEYLDGASSDRVPSSISELVDAIAVLVDSGESAEETGAAEAVVPNPYKGLLPYEFADAASFHGREDVIEEIVDLIRSRPFVALVGASGSGKSSVARAGVLPALRNGAVSGSHEWLLVTMTPGQRPLEQLANALDEVLVAGTVADGGAHLITSAEDAVDLLHQAAAACGSQLLLLIDQFEELFTTADSDTADTFVAMLERLASVDTPLVRVLATIRADYFDRPLADHRVGELLRSATVFLGAMRPDRLADALAAPARGVGVDVDSSVLAALVAESAAHPAALPLLQVAVRQMFDDRTGERITADNYRRLGGLAGAIAAVAEAVLGSLDAELQGQVRTSFDRLIAVSEIGPARRRATWSEIADMPGAPGAPTVLERFAAARLLAFDRDAATREPTIEVAHEALLDGWPRLAGWIAEDREHLRSLNVVASSAADWERNGRDERHLLEGLRLATAHALSERNRDRLTSTEHDFIQTSVLADQRRRDLDRRRVRRLRTALVASSLLVAAVLVAAGALVRARDSADRSRGEAQQAQQIAQSQQTEAAAAAERANDLEAEAQELEAAAGNSASQASAAETSRRASSLAAASAASLTDDADEALLLAVEAVRTERTPTTIGALQRALAARDPRLIRTIHGAGYQFAFLGNDRLATTRPQSVAVIDIATAAEVWSLDGVYEQVTAAPDGSMVVVATRSTQTWSLLDGTSGAAIAEHPIDPTYQTTFAFSDDSRLLIVAAESDGGTYITVLDTTAPDQPAVATVTSTSFNISDYALNDSHTRLVAIAEGRIVEWDLTTSTTVQRDPLPFPEVVFAIDYHGDRLWTVSGTRTDEAPTSLRLIDSSTGALNEVELGTGLGSMDQDALVAPIPVRLDVSDRVAVVASGRRSVRVDLATGEVFDLAMDTRPSDLPWSIALSADGTRFAAQRPGGELDGTTTIDIFTTGGDGPIATTVDASPPISVVLSPDGGWIGIVNGFNRSMVALDNAQPVARFEESGRTWHAGDVAVWDTAEASDSQGAATTATVRRWDPELAAFAELPGGSRGAVAAIADDTVRGRVAFGYVDGRIDIVAIDDGRRLTTLEPASREPPTALEFSPDGTSLLVVSARAGITDIDIATGQRALAPDSIGTTTLSFDPTGRFVVSASPDALDVRSVDSLDVIASAPRPFAAGVVPDDIAFSVDGKIVAVGGTGQLFDVATATPIGEPFPQRTAHDPETGRPITAAWVRNGVLATNTEGGVVLWQLDVDAWIDIACQTAGPTLPDTRRAALGLAAAEVEACPVP